MTFKEEMVSDFKSSMSFLVDSMLETLNYASKGNFIGTKPSHTVQTEKFFSFYEKVMSSSGSDQTVLMENLRSKVVAPVYEKYSINFMNHLVSSEGSVEDDFLKVKGGDDQGSLKIRITPDGLFFQISKVFLPVSEVYTEAVKISLKNKEDNLPFPNKILLGLYSTVFFAVRDTLGVDARGYFDENIKTLKESLDVCDEVKPAPRDNGPMGMIKNMLGNIDMNQIGDMMAKVSGDEKSSKEFSEVFGKLSDSIKSGKNPLDVMGDIIKEATMTAASAQDDGAEETTSVEEADGDAVPELVDTTDGADGACGAEVTDGAGGAEVTEGREEVTDAADVTEMELPASGLQ